jgi:hypothetical protein
MKQLVSRHYQHWVEIPWLVANQGRKYPIANVQIGSTLFLMNPAVPKSPCAPHLVGVDGEVVCPHAMRRTRLSERVAVPAAALVLADILHQAGHAGRAATSGARIDRTRFHHRPAPGTCRRTSGRLGGSGATGLPLLSAFRGRGTCAVSSERTDRQTDSAAMLPTCRRAAMPASGAWVLQPGGSSSQERNGICPRKDKFARGARGSRQPEKSWHDA